jgi:hypothetical protein
MKKTWETPKLIVLVRNNPQEAVLSVCKGYVDALIAGDGGPNSYESSCMMITGSTAFQLCEECSAAATS